MADFITELSDRRILPAVGVYVASSWVLIEILDRATGRVQDIAARVAIA